MAHDTDFYTENSSGGDITCPHCKNSIDLQRAEASVRVLQDDLWSRQAADLLVKQEERKRLAALKPSDFLVEDGDPGVQRV